MPALLGPRITSFGSKRACSVCQSKSNGAGAGEGGGGVTRDAALMFLLREWPRCPRAPSAPGQHLAPLFASHLLGNVS